MGCHRHQSASHGLRQALRRRAFHAGNGADIVSSGHLAHDRRCLLDVALRQGYCHRHVMRVRVHPQGADAVASHGISHRHHLQLPPRHARPEEAPALLHLRYRVLRPLCRHRSAAHGPRHRSAKREIGPDQNTRMDPLLRHRQLRIHHDGLVLELHQLHSQRRTSKSELRHHGGNSADRFHHRRHGCAAIRTGSGRRAVLHVGSNHDPPNAALHVPLHSNVRQP
mmetsp:Transcript_14451/g.39814  ORF Transcript_14451/g.39814 Transcript_14451/m.39814 type:complete len:224 (-) Transcript_14451:3173-3844(-)